jgi:hypothetical protein
MLATAAISADAIYPVRSAGSQALVQLVVLPAGPAAVRAAFSGSTCWFISSDALLKMIQFCHLHRLPKKLYKHHVHAEAA